jgi:hypothetical protein
MKFIASWKGDDGRLRERIFVSQYSLDNFIRSLNDWGMSDIAVSKETIPDSTVILGKIKNSYVSLGMNPALADKRINQMITRR